MIKYNACPQWATVSGRKVLESPGERRLCTVRVWCTQVRGKTWETPNALDSKEIKQSILKEINLEYSLEGLMPKCQYFGHLMQRANSLEKTLMLEKLEVRRRRGWHRMRCMASLTQWPWVWANSGRWGWRGMLACCSPWGRKELHRLNNNKSDTGIHPFVSCCTTHTLPSWLQWGPCSGHKSISTCSQEANQQFRFCYYNLPWPGAHSFTFSSLNFLIC